MFSTFPLDVVSMTVLPYHFNILFTHCNNVDKPVDVIFKVLFKCLILMLSRCHCLNIALTFFPDIELIWINQLELILFRRLFYNVDSMPDFHNVSISLSKHCPNFLVKHWINIGIALLWHLLYNVVSMLAFDIVSIASMFLRDIEPLLIKQ